MYLPGDGKARKQNSLVGLPAGTGAAEAVTELGQQLCATLIKLAGTSSRQGEPQSSYPEWESEFVLSIISPGYYSQAFAPGHTQ